MGVLGQAMQWSDDGANAGYAQLHWGQAFRICWMGLVAQHTLCPFSLPAELCVHVCLGVCRSLGVYALPPLTHNGEEVRAVNVSLLLLRSHELPGANVCLSVNSWPD